MKRVSALLPLFLLVSAFLAGSAFAADRSVVIMVVDRDSGQALIPEGTPMPHGLRVFAADGKVLTFAHAPENRFTKARETVTATASLAPKMPFVVRERDERNAPGRVPKSDSRFVVRPNVEESDVTYYVYFYDGSYISAQRRIYSVGGGQWHYAVQTAGYTPENDYYNGWIYVEQSSGDHPGYDVTAYCTINYAGGYCSTPTYAYQAGDNFSAHVTSSGNIHHHRLPICDQYGEPPCNENLSGSIEIYFP